MATIADTLLTPEGEARVAKLFFRPLQTPYFSSGGLVTTQTPTVTTDEDGAFSIVLAQGQYEVTVGADKFEIEVPAGAATYTFEDVAITELPFMPAASNTYQGTFPIEEEDFELPANPIATPGDPVATGWTATVHGPGKYQVEACIAISATSRNVEDGINENEKYTAYLWNATDEEQVGLELTIQDIYTGTKGQMILRGTVEISGETNVLIEIYAAGNPNTDNSAESPNSVGTLIAAESSITISRLP